ncbi:ATP-binding protein [Ruminococcus flavefaciens]|uniref:tRNA(Ile)-lysidine synthase TilS/MesJ n=1 Tax=Ruminococcus flavefaciens TaxID=1265 RepID=A0A315XW94_RUMFL|nr:ATP-binding protein [Ruminococcus flavefaciens]PWJ11538.1 tRNA(Ile)-lysidine synthase TilS/MesJ [Ruminococcus flavefaciens]SSA50447.1 tRNA(Ile)-lysidine synthase TilS/MesJ [Ruminococcus flavefaciens]
MGNSITAEELAKLESGSFTLIDIRDSSAFEYGHIDGAVNIAQEDISAAELHDDRKFIICCRSGIISRDIADELCDKGFDAYNLEGGYVEWLRLKMENSQVTEAVELSLRKKFKKSIWCKFTKAINEYELVKPNDKIAVCISGGKDSMLMAKLFQELKRHDKFPFEVVFLVMDPGYSPENRRVIEENARSMSIPVHIFESDIFDSVYNIEKNPCYICARMRRGYLYSHAKALGCNKIALGHHFDDVIETILMGMLYGGQVQTMMPKLHSTNFEGMELIRPLYLVREDDIKHWRDYNGLHFIQCACKFTDTCTTCAPDSRSVSKRLEIKNLIAELKKVNPQVEKNIFRSVENVNVNTVIAYKDDDGVHRFLDTYDTKADS